MRDIEESELERCAAFIRADLGLGDMPIDLNAALQLCELHGGASAPFSGEHYGETHDEAIRVNASLLEPLEARVCTHELLHRLTNSPRYELLNPVATDASRRQWIEALVRRVTDG